MQRRQEEAVTDQNQGLILLLHSTEVRSLHSARLRILPFNLSITKISICNKLVQKYNFEEILIMK